MWLSPNLANMVSASFDFSQVARVSRLSTDTSQDEDHFYFEKVGRGQMKYYPWGQNETFSISRSISLGG